MYLRCDWLIKEVGEKLALHKQTKKKKQYPGNYTLYPNFNDKFLIQYNKELKCWRVVHYSRFAFRGQWTIHGSRFGGFGHGSFIRRHEWEYQKKFETEISALEFAKDKAKQRNMSNAIFLLQMEV